MAMYGNQGPSSSQYYNPSQQTCHNTLYNCSQSCVEGFSYCLDHISEDRNAPYRSCTFVFSNGKRCATNVLKGERRDGYESLCFFVCDLFDANR